MEPSSDLFPIVTPAPIPWCSRRYIEELKKVKTSTDKIDPLKKKANIYKLKAKQNGIKIERFQKYIESLKEEDPNEIMNKLPKPITVKILRKNKTPFKVYKSKNDGEEQKDKALKADVNKLKVFAFPNAEDIPRVLLPMASRPDFLSNPNIEGEISNENRNGNLKKIIF